MVTSTQAEVMTLRLNAGKNALRFFKEIKHITSGTDPTNPQRLKDARTVRNYRHAARFRNDQSLVQSFHDAVSTGAGNCGEKGMICYMSLHGNPTLLSNTWVTLVDAVSFDHCFVVLSDRAFRGQVEVEQLGETAMICDGWTEDCHFPNLNRITARLRSLSVSATVRQIAVRDCIARHRLQPKPIWPLSQRPQILYR